MSDANHEALAEAIDDYAMQPVLFLASAAELTDGEIVAFRHRANEAESRIGTDAERWGSGGLDRVDQRAVKLWEAVAVVTGR